MTFSDVRDIFEEVPLPVCLVGYERHTWTDLRFWCSDMLDDILDFMRLRREDIEFMQSDSPTLTTGQAAEVFGFSYSTLLRRLQAVRYGNIRKENTPRGWVLDMEDVFQAAYPGASKDQIAVLMRDYREERRRRREERHLRRIQDR